MIAAFKIPLTDRLIAGALHLPDGIQKAPWVVLCHGLFSSMVSEKFTELAERLCSCGIAAMRFDFSGCGASTGSIAETTVTRRLQELDAVVRTAEGHACLGQAGGLMGSSLGGFVGLLYAGQRRSFKALSVWAAPYELSIIRANIPSQDLARLKPEFFTDAAHYQPDIPGLKVPLQIIHGSCDEIVPVAHAERIHAQAPCSRAVIIEGADHTISDPQHRNTALAECCVWFQQHLLIK